MIQVNVKNNLTFPSEVLIQKDLKYIADRIFIPELQKGIYAQRQIDGSAFPELEPATKKAKSGDISNKLFTKSGKLRESASKKIEKVGLKGTNPMTLIQEGKLVSSFRASNIGKNSVRININDEREEIAEYLQIEGVGKKKKKFIFFGISEKMEAKAIVYIKDKIRAIIRGAK